MTALPRWPVAIIGSSNIATDLMLKISQGDGPLSVGATADGLDGVLRMPGFADIKLIFDASSALTHRTNWEALRNTKIRILDLTPASIGAFCVPAVNLDEHLDAPHLNMVTCGGQATVPIVAAVGNAGIVSYAEAVSSISAQSAGPGTRADIDEFIETTAAALRFVGGAQRGKAVIILNPADPPVLMRSTVYCLVDGDCDHDRIEQEILGMVDRVAAYVPGYRLKRDVQFEIFDNNHPLYIPETGKFTGARVTVMLEVAGCAHYLPDHAGNLDIMTSAAKAAAERIALHAAENAGATT